MRDQTKSLSSSKLGPEEAELLAAAADARHFNGTAGLCERRHRLHSGQLSRLAAEHELTIARTISASSLATGCAPGARLAADPLAEPALGLPRRSRFNSASRASHHQAGAGLLVQRFSFWDSLAGGTQAECAGQRQQYVPATRAEQRHEAAAARHQQQSDQPAGGWLAAARKR